MQNLAELYSQMRYFKRRYNNENPAIRRGMLSHYVTAVETALKQLEELNRDVVTHDARLTRAVKDEIANRLCDLNVPLDIIYAAVYGNDKITCVNILEFSYRNERMDKNNEENK